MLLPFGAIFLWELIFHVLSILRNTKDNLKNLASSFFIHQTGKLFQSGNKKRWQERGRTGHSYTAASRLQLYLWCLISWASDLNRTSIIDYSLYFVEYLKFFLIILKMCPARAGTEQVTFFIHCQIQRNNG